MNPDKERPVQIFINPAQMEEWIAIDSALNDWALNHKNQIIATPMIHHQKK